MRVARGLAVLVVLMFTSASAMAAGFRLPEAGAKAMGMGFAFTAQADDPSAIYFNPAGLTQLEGNNFKGGITYVKENGATFTGTTPLTGGATVTETQKDLDFFIPNLFFTRKASPNFAYGIGVFSPFGWQDENPNTSIFRNQITKIELMTIVVNPTVAWKVNEVLSIGAGIDFMYGSATLEKTPFSGALGGNLYNSKLKETGMPGDTTWVCCSCRPRTGRWDFPTGVHSHWRSKTRMWKSEISIAPRPPLFSEGRPPLTPRDPHPSTCRRPLRSELPTQPTG
jgi:long-subunit fatty acid transport protein